jgi:hypothetical protein
MPSRRLVDAEGEADALRRAGAQTVWMGLSQLAKDPGRMDKGTKVEQIHEAARRLKRGIRGFFAVWLPGRARRYREDHPARARLRAGRHRYFGILCNAGYQIL